MDRGSALALLKDQVKNKNLIKHMLATEAVMSSLARRFNQDEKLWALTGLLVAAALVHPQKKLSAIDVDFALNRFKEKNFARGANREQIESCRELGLSLEEFIALSLAAMEGISRELGL